MSLPSRHISFAGIILHFSQLGGYSPLTLQPPYWSLYTDVERVEMTWLYFSYNTDTVRAKRSVNESQLTTDFLPDKIIFRVPEFCVNFKVIFGKLKHEVKN